MERIPVFKPLLEREELDAAAEALSMGWLGMGAYVGSFEEKVKDFLGITDRQTVAVSTGHAALHLGLLLAGVGPGDEVITPSFNNIADFQAILAVGAQPVFCDIDDRSLCIDMEKAEALVTPRTKAIIVMDYDCMLCDHGRVKAFAERHQLRVIHDAAHAFGSRDGDRMVGSFSDICMFSFDPVKTITCIDGGMLVVRTPEERDRLHEMRLIGMGQPASVMYQNQRAWTYDVRSLGFRYHMANLHAAIGLQQLAKMPAIAETRRAACRFYNKQLSDIRHVRVPDTTFDNVTAFLYYIRVPAAIREPLRKWMGDKSVDTGIHWQPGHGFKLFENCRRGDLSVTEKVGQEIFSLPLHSKMSTTDQERVVESIQSFFEQH